MGVARSWGLLLSERVAASVAGRRVRQTAPSAENCDWHSQRVSNLDDGEALLACRSSIEDRQLIRLRARDRNDSSGFADREEFTMTPTRAPRGETVGAITRAERRGFWGHLPPPLCERRRRTQLRGYADLRKINWLLVRTGRSTCRTRTAGGAAGAIDSAHRN